jgi:short-subunit dehydrogenase
MNVVLNGRRADRLERVASDVARSGRSTETVVGDVCAPGMSARLLDAAEQRFGGFDVVFANAGYGLNRPMHELGESDLRRIFDVNFFAATDLLCQAARRLIAAHRPGHLLMCSSSIAKFSLPTFAAYSATKAAQNHVCRAMRLELRPHGIEVASVHPITTRTEFFATAAQLSGQALGAAGPDQLPRWLVQSPERVARAVVARLRKPQPEVWTSTFVRIVAGVVTIFPSLLDRVAGMRPRR